MAWEETSNVEVAAAATTIYGASSSEANSKLATSTVNLPSCEVFTCPCDSQEFESFNLDVETYVPNWNWWNPLDEPSFDVEPGMNPSHFFPGGPE